MNEIDKNRMQQLEFMLDESLQRQKKLTLLNQAFEVTNTKQKILQASAVLEPPATREQGIEANLDTTREERTKDVREYEIPQDPNVAKGQEVKRSDKTETSNAALQTEIVKIREA